MRTFSAIVVVSLFFYMLNQLTRPAKRLVRFNVSSQVNDLVKVMTRVSCKNTDVTALFDNFM